MKNKVAYLGMATAISLILSYIEGLIPIAPMVPGIKLGLTNIVVLMLLITLGWKSALVVSFMRVLIAGFLFGNLSMIMYSLTGAVISLFGMYFFLQTKKFSVISISIFGGILHNAGQLLLAIIVLKSKALLFYAPVLFMSGLLTGALIGFIVKQLKVYLNGEIHVD